MGHADTETRDVVFPTSYTYEIPSPAYITRTVTSPPMLCMITAYWLGPSLPCDALRCTVFLIVILSVRLSVRLSVCHTRGLWYGSPIILVSGDITFIPKFEGGHPERGRLMRVGWVRIGDFRPISRRISETVRDTT